jgi:hypothetical protein
VGEWELSTLHSQLSIRIPPTRTRNPQAQVGGRVGGNYQLSILNSQFFLPKTTAPIIATSRKIEAISKGSR